MTQRPIERVVELLRNNGCNPRQSGPTQWESKCPVGRAHKHGDKNPSLGVSEGVDGKTLLYCHGGCTVRDIAGGLGLKLNDLFPDKPSASHIDGGRRIRATYDYYDADGALVFQVVRYDPKDFRQRQPDGKGGWIYSIKSITEKPLYNLPQVLAAIDAGKPVWIVEGEKDAENLQWHVDGAVTTNSGGATKWRSEYDRQLEGVRHVIIVQDADDPGTAHARLVARRMVDLGASVEVRRPPGGHKDISAALAVDLSPDDCDIVWTSALPWERWDAPEGEPIEEPVDAADETPETLALALTALRIIDWPHFWSGETDGPDWLMEPIIAKGRGHALYAGAKSGKSLLMLAAVAAVASGKPFLNNPARHPQHVLYLDYEMTEDDLRERLETFGYGPDDDLSHLHYALLPTIDPLDTEMGAAAVVMAAQHFQAVHVVIDTTSRAISGEENSADTFRAFYRLTGLRLKAAGIGYHRLDHSGKDVERGQRGSSAKNDDVDVVQQLVVRDKGAVTLKATHRRMAWVPDAVDISRGDEGGVLTYSTAKRSDPTGTWHIVEWLDARDVPTSMSRPRVRDLLKSHGVAVANDALSAALRARREREQNAPLLPEVPVRKPSGQGNTHTFDEDERTGPDRTQNPRSDGADRAADRSGQAAQSQTDCPPHVVGDRSVTTPSQTIEELIAAAPEWGDLL